MNHPYEAAVAYIADDFLDRPDNESAAHTTFIGLRKVGSEYRLEEPDCVVVQVPHSKAEFKAHGGDKALPPDLMLGGERIRVDVQDNVPKHTPEILHAKRFDFAAHYVAQAGERHKECAEYLVKGGHQIQPPPGEWVGTAGCMMGFKQPDGSVKWGMITNAHVTGFDLPPGSLIGQPSFRNPFARLIKVFPIDFALGAKNEVDLALLDCLNNEGKLTCSPEFVMGGKLLPEWGDSQLREYHQKDGRTTGYTDFMCVGIGGVSTIEYGPGQNGRFVSLDVHAKQGGGDPSKPGDSGSAIRSRENHLRGLLFAGGGGQTLAIPARNVIKWAQGVLYSGE